MNTLEHESLSGDPLFFTVFFFVYHSVYKIALYHMTRTALRALSLQNH